EEGSQDRGRGRSDGGRVPRVRRVGRRRRVQRGPARVGLRGGVAVLVGPLDRRHRPPQGVVVLALARGLQPVVQGDVQEGEQAGVLDQGGPLVRGPVLGDAVPDLVVGQGQPPDQGRLGLVLGAGGAVQGPQLFGLVERHRVFGAGQGGRRRGA